MKFTEALRHLLDGRTITFYSKPRRRNIFYKLENEILMTSCSDPTQWGRSIDFDFNSYSREDWQVHIHTFEFEEALGHLKNGHKVARKNEPNYYYEIVRHPLQIAVITTNNEICRYGGLSSEDLLADNWHLFT